MTITITNRRTAGIQTVLHFNRITDVSDTDTIRSSNSRWQGDQERGMSHLEHARVMMLHGYLNELRWRPYALADVMEFIAFKTGVPFTKSRGAGKGSSLITFSDESWLERVCDVLTIPPMQLHEVKDPCTDEVYYKGILQDEAAFLAWKLVTLRKGRRKGGVIGPPECAWGTMTPIRLEWKRVRGAEPYALSVTPQSS